MTTDLLKMRAFRLGGQYAAAKAVYDGHRVPERIHVGGSSTDINYFGGIQQALYEEYALLASG